MKLGIELRLDQLSDMRVSLLAAITYLQTEATFGPTKARRDVASELITGLQRARSWLPASADPLGAASSDRLSRAVTIKCQECGHEDDAHRFLRDVVTQRQCPKCQAITNIHGAAA